MKGIFYPKQIVVVGVSENPDNLSRHIAQNLIRFGYPGDLYFLGRKPGVLDGKTIFASPEELPYGIDLAVILTPAATVPDLVDQLGRQGVKFAAIETAGFSEFSEEGRILENMIAENARKWGMRIVGPNCIGIINTENGICTVFVPTEPQEVKKGRVALMAQSGGVVLTCMDMLTAAGLGVGKTASVGNKLDYKESDYLKYFLEDPSTDLIMLYLESVVEGRQLVELAGKAQKPIIVYKSNTGQASAQIAQSHTAALANDESVVNAALRQYGITRATTFRNMMTFGKAFSLPPVRGNRLGVFSRSGGHAIVSVDTATEFGFELPPFPDSVIETARPFFRVNVIDRQNPLDLGTVFQFNGYVDIIESAIQQRALDAVLLVFNYRRETIPVARQVAEKLRDMSRKSGVPIALCYFTEMDEVEYLERNLGFPIFTEVYDAVQALAVSRDHYIKVKRRQEYSQMEVPALIPADARQKALTILENCHAGEVQIDQAFNLCSAYGIPVAPWRVFHGKGEAVRAAEEIGFPVALKIAEGGSVHKTEVGGVILNIATVVEMVQAVEEMQNRLNRHGLGHVNRFLVQKMTSGGREVIMGGKNDPAFGPLVLVGLGGIYAEVLKDVSVRLAPIYFEEAAEMLSELRGLALLKGVRGQKPADLKSLTNTLFQLSQLMADLPTIAELDLNPVLAFESGAWAVDARIVLKP